MSNELDEMKVAGTGGEGVKPAETPEPVFWGRRRCAEKES